MAEPDENPEAIINSDPRLASTMRAEYIPPTYYSAARKDIPKRRALFKSKVIKEMIEEINQENLIKPEVEDYCTTYDDMFRIPGFKVQDKEPDNTELYLKYPLYSQQPITYYSSLVKSSTEIPSIPGITRITNRQDPFRKNGSFTTPVHLRFDEPA